MNTRIRLKSHSVKGRIKMKLMYNGLIVINSRTGRQYENSCDLCVNLKRNYDIDNKATINCSLYPAMENNIRCIQYVARKQTTQAKFAESD